MAPNPRPSSRQAGQLLLYLSAVSQGSKACVTNRGILLVKLADVTQAQKFQFATAEVQLTTKHRDENQTHSPSDWNRFM